MSHHAHPTPPGGIHELPKIHAAGASDTAGHHGHHIVSASTLLIVLVALFGFTVLTVGASMAEEFIAQAFHLTIPAWVNVAVALSIAAVKTTLVVMYFMQLRYDNPINTMIFIFTLMAVACFLGFTMLDLGNRQTIDRFKGAYIVDGGTGLDGSGIPITRKAANEAQAKAAQEKADALLGGEKANATATAEHVDAHAKPATPNRSSAQKSRPVRGLTLESAGGEPHH